MTKLTKRITCAVLALALVGAGVWALAQYGFRFGGKVTFDTEAFAVDIAGKVEHAGTEISVYNFDSSANETPEDWDIPDIRLSRTNNTVTYIFEFTNYGTSAVLIEFTLPAVPAEFTLDGGCLGENSAELESGGTVTFTYTLALTDFSGTQSLTLDFSVSVAEAE